jgi:Ca2+-binding EF-hand superfamily protein
MMRTLLALLLAGVLAPAVSAQDAVAPPAMMAPAKQPAPAADKDNLDFLYLASDRPVLLRVHVRHGDKPYFTAWDAYVKRLFDYFDLDRDGKLSRKEADHIPQAQNLSYQLQGVIVGIGFQKAPWDQLDRNKDGKVTPHELGEYLRTGGIEPMMTTDSSTRSTSDEITATLYRRLDTNKDGKLTEEELKKAPALLAGLDSNEDEALTGEEVRGTVSSNQFGYALNTQSQAINAESGLVQIPSEAAHAGLARQVLGRYDRNKDGKLSRGESGLDEATFKKLDGNHDGQLNAAELAGFFRRDADLELVARPSPSRPVANATAEVINKVSMGLGFTAMTPRSADVFNPSKRDMPLASRLRRDNPQGVGIVLGDTDLSLAVPASQGTNFSGVKQYYLQQFKQADTKKKGYLERKQATDPFLGQFFEMADRKGEGKMYEKDLKNLLDIQEEGAGCRLQLDVNDQGRSLFDLLDVNHDGRLSQRELRDGWAQLKAYAHGKEGLARGDITRRLQVQIAAGANQYGPRPVVAIAYYGQATPAAAPSKAPRWFTQMDRNRDNDVSRAEFLGPEEAFRQMDGDGDGLISVKEAVRYEQARKKGK